MSEPLEKRLLGRYPGVEAPMHKAFDAWAENQANRPGSNLVPVPFDTEKYPWQSITEAKTEAKDPHPKLPDTLYYGMLFARVARSIGPMAARQFYNRLCSQPASAENPFLLPGVLKRAQEEGQNTLVMTPHFSLAEMGYFKALRFAAKRDRPNIMLGGVLMNKLMGRQEYRGKNLAERFRPLGNIWWSLPKSKSARRFGVPSGASLLANALLSLQLRKDLALGGIEMDAALTGSELRSVKDKGEIIGYEFPDIDSGSVNLLKNFHNILPAALMKHPDTAQWKMYIGELLPVQELLKSNSPAEITDSVFSIFQAEISRYTGRGVNYRKLVQSGGNLAIRGDF